LLGATINVDGITIDNYYASLMNHETPLFIFFLIKKKEFLFFIAVVGKLIAIFVDCIASVACCAS